MKKILSLSLLMVSFVSEASPVYPNVINFGSSVQVQVYNSTAKSISCSGTVNMYFTSGYSETHFYSDFLSSGRTSYQMFYPRNYMMQISFVSPSISCYEVR